jgi:hypothetical protein
MRRVLIAIALALLVSAACLKAEKAGDLAVLKPKAERPMGGAPGPADMKKLIDCCDENARAMGAECCLQLEDLLQAQVAAKGGGKNMGMAKEMPPGMPGMPGAPGAPDGGAFKTGRPAQVEPAIAARWPKVKLAVGPKTGAGKEIVIPVGQKAKVDGTPLEIEVIAFVPAFKMTADAIVSDGAEPTNPAAKVTIREAGKPDWSGWLFAKMPEVHAFPHDSLRVALVEGVQK